MKRIVVALVFAVCFAGASRAAEVSFYPLPGIGFVHDVAAAADGAVWYTDQGKGMLGRLDPKTGKTEEIALGPITGQRGVHGRVDPATGKVDAWASPRPGSYGITATPAGEVWFAGLAGDYIGHIDRATGTVDAIDSPRKGMGPRRIWSDSKGTLWVSFWNSGGIGRYDPATKAWKIYSMPKSTSGTYSVYVDDKDRVWATDWPANTIQRFDPATETFASFQSDKRGANVRQMLGRPGEAWGAESGTGRLVVIRD